MKNLMENTQVDVKEVKQLMESQDVRKVPGPDGVPNWIMKECSNQLTGKLHSIIESSLKESRVPLDWKKENIVPIHKGDKKRTIKLQTSIINKRCGKNL